METQEAKYKYYFSYWYETEGNGVFIGNAFLKSDYDMNIYEEAKIGIDNITQNLKDHLKCKRVVIQNWIRYEN